MCLTKVYLVLIIQLIHLITDCEIKEFSKSALK